MRDWRRAWRAVVGGMSGAPFLLRDWVEDGPTAGVSVAFVPSPDDPEQTERRPGRFSTD
jgi:hypothetical protein